MPPPPSGNDQFFITENILEGDSRIIHEERSQQESELDNVPENDEFNQAEEMEESEGEEMEMDANFDFGKAKMDYFKQRAKDILMNESEIEYEGNAMQLGVCFKNLKNAIRNPIVVHGGSENKPHYLKMTFSTCRAAVNGDRFLEMSKLIGKDGSLMPGASNQSTSSVLAVGASSKIPALMRAGKDQYAGEEGSALLLMDGTMKKKTKKEEMIDKKIEYLLETYKKQDEALMRKATDKSSKKRQERKNLRDKFGFSDEDDDDNDGGRSSNQSRNNRSDAHPDSKRSKDFLSTGKFQSSQGGNNLPPVTKKSVF